MATFRKLPSGKWQARVSKEGKEFSIGTFRTKKEAEIEAGKVEERIFYGQALNDRNMLFNEVVEEWLKYKKLDMKPNSYEGIERITRIHLLPFFESQRIMKIRRKDIKNWITHYASLDLSHGSKSKYLSILKSIFHYAVYDLEVLEKSPCDKLSMPVKDSLEADEEVKYYSLNELEGLLKYMKNKKTQRYGDYQLYYMLMYFLSKTGLRISEALAVRWSDIKDNKLSVERQIKKINNKKKLDTLKSSSSYRTITLDDDLIKELRKFKIKQNEMILENPHIPKNKDDIIFQNYLGDYLDTRAVRKSFERYCKRIGLEYKGTHVFRHTHAVLLLEAGASIKYVSERLGHKSIKTTSDIYLAVTEKIDQDELNKFTAYTRDKI
ncbi:tyrosine-type recombinase/integrase [Lysinibacillus odysseyi]|uniref:Recombinase XerC n=1 Tax=Lysinibacillus odysseyi 34hs-1 = NBRC 100172 TaxID=1220589 RepID=A0A0A3JKM8_9BACI|nr:site-specific integrase [Lysinibacillus odysseyi]KGR87557.1 recombinase XerC [Lysinibacillus odysseyi 34hs-1 = NBRC 100172]